MLCNCLVEAVKLTENVDPNKYGHTVHGIGFDTFSQFSWGVGSWGKNSVIFVHVDNKK